MSRKILGLAASALLICGSAHAASLTASEIQQIENEFGITLSSNEIEKLSAVVYPTNSAQWRADAYSRIDTSRKADLDIQVVDMNGDPVEGATVAVKMKSNDFKFGGTFSAKDFSDVDGNLNISTNTYHDRLLSMFNAVGLNNGFKPKLTSIHDDVPAVTNWTAANNLPLRGHLLIWPGSGDVATMDDPGSVSGVDYGKHLSTASTSAYASYDVLGAVEIYKASSRTPADKAALKAVVDAEISEWAGTWNVYEWDVINETLGNQLLMEILGEDQMAEWFKIADTNKVSADTKLLINEYQIISAMSESRTPGWYTTRRDNYMTNINQIISDGGQIDRIGFQSRIKSERRDPQLIYDRLEEWGNTYGLEMVGTEFEVVDSESTNDWKWYIYTEDERAQITEEMMTQYFSHPLVTGLMAWNTINDDIEALVDYSGNPTIHGLVWYYPHRIRYNTDTTLASGLDGRTGLRAFKGDYEITVRYKGQEYVAPLAHTNDQAIVFPLNSTIVDGSYNAQINDAWNYAGLTNSSGLSSAVSTGLVGGVSTPDHPLASIQNETVRWQSDGVTDSVYRNIVPSSSAGANAGLYQLSMDYLDADFSASAAVSNGSGRVAIGMRNNSSVDVNFRLFFNSGGGSTPEYWLQVSDDLGNNQTIATFPGATLDHLNVRAVYDFDDMGSAGSYQVYYRFDGGSEVAAYTAGQLPTGFALDKLRLTVQTYNGGVNWSAGDRIFTDNLVLSSLSEPPPVFFTVDPINRPDADSDIAYTGQSITGTASNAVSYSVVAGPAWLSITANGDLSGTPTTDDIGANSWIVQASNGLETDTAVLHITVNGAGGGPGGNISFAHESDDKPDAPGTDDTTFADISVQAGDVVAVSTAPNKSYAINPLALVWSGTEGVDGNTTTVKPGDLDSRTSYVFYTKMINNGTYTFIVDGNGTGLTARSKLFVLRANSGNIGIADEATLSSNTSTPGLSYDFSPETLPASAIAIESFASKTGGTLTPDAAYTEDFDTATRHLVHSTSVNGSTWSKNHVNSSGPAKFSGAGVVFYEQTSGADNAPPVFNSDPVSEVDATQDVVYNASLADNATDDDSDPMSFGIISGPAWLNVITNTGALSGIPASSDLGTNSWKVSVTDGIATNFATLQVYVNEPATPPPSPYEGTNILFIAIDDMKTLLGCYGDAQAITPEIDSLASQGVTFLNAQCQWAVCGPSRASVMTGLYPEETGVMGFKKMRGDAVDGDRVNSVIRPNVVTLQQYFRYNGYRTAATGKINDPRCVGTLDTVTGKVAEDGADVDDPPSWGPPVNPNSLPSDFFTSSAYVRPASGWSPAGKPSTGVTNLPDSAFTDGIICDEGITLLQNLATNDTQFFLGVGFKKPHLPFVAPQQYWDLYDRTNDFSIAPFQDHPTNEVSYSWKYATELAAYDEFYDSSPGSTEPAVGIPCTDVPEWKQLELIHGYYACASFIDAQIGRLLGELETLGLHTNTIVVIWGDHGFHLGDHAEWAKHTNLEQGSRSPLIVYSPFTGSAGAKPAAPVNFVDLYPTLCELAGLPVPEQPLAENEDPFDPSTGRAIKGTSLVPVMQDPSAFVRTGALTLFSRDGAMGYSYRTERYRYIEWIDAGIVAQELYDYELDPLETINLAYEPGFDGLMYQFSRAMREELNALALSGGDVACPELQGSPAVALPANTYLPYISGTISASDFELAWPDAAYSTYNILQKNNLLDATWSIHQADVSGSPQSIAITNDAAFYRIEVSN